METERRKHIRKLFKNESGLGDVVGMGFDKV